MRDDDGNEAPALTFRLNLGPRGAWIALLVGLPLLIAGAFAAQALLERRLGTQVNGVVETWIVMRLQEPAVAQMRDAMAAGDVPRAELERLGESLADAPQVTLGDVRVHGWGSKVVLRVEYTAERASGEAYPDPSAGVRYFRAAWLPFTGWTLTRETHPAVYYLELF